MGAVGVGTALLMEAQVGRARGLVESPRCWYSAVMKDTVAGTPEAVLQDIFDFAEGIGLEGARFRWATFGEGPAVFRAAEVYISSGLEQLSAVHPYPSGALGERTVGLVVMRQELLWWLESGELLGVTLPRSDGGLPWAGYRSRREYSSSRWPSWRFHVGLESFGAAERRDEPLLGRGVPAWPSRAAALHAWFHGPENSAPNGQLRIIVDDRRYRIARLEWHPSWQPTRVDVHVEGSRVEESHLVVWQGPDPRQYGGDPLSGQSVDLPSQPVNSIPVAPESRAMVVYLLDPNGGIAHEVQPARIGAEPPEGVEPTLLEQIEEDLRLGEGDRVEFKPYVMEGHEKEQELVRTVVAFSNSQGGRLYVGVNDDGSLSGAAKYRDSCKNDLQRTPERLEKWFRKLVAEKIKPTPLCDVCVIEYQGQTILVAVIRRGPERPYSTTDNDIRIRSGATNRRPDPRTELRDLFPPEERRTVHVDGMVVV